MADFNVNTMHLATSSRGFATLKHDAQSLANGLVGDLADSADMAGDDEAGHAFAKVYEPAARETVEQLAFSAYVLASTSAGLMEMAFQYLAAEDATAKAMLDKHPVAQDIDRLRNAASECDPTGSSRQLPRIIHKDSFADTFFDPDSNPTARGDYEKLGDIAAMWHKAGGLTEALADTAQMGVRRLKSDCTGKAMDAFYEYCDTFIGTRGMPGEVADGEPLLPNLAAACYQISRACKAYADHIMEARTELFDLTPRWSREGPLDEVVGDSRIRSLGDIPGVLNGSGKRIRLPNPDGRPGLPGLPPLFPVPVPLPPLVPAAAHGPAPAMVLASQQAPPVMLPPITPPVPPYEAPLSPKEQAEFKMWADGLPYKNPGSRPADEYQKRVSGSPERGLPLPPGWPKHSGRLMADGLRATDGAAVEAKYVKQPGCSPRTLNNMNKSNGRIWETNMYNGDLKEMAEYGQAMTVPGNKVRFVEVNTNDSESLAYWRFLMATNHVDGYARHTP
ncbi:restriction endonuclease fold toxin-2 domain-containing protein [Streptomyces tubercidicus]